MKNSDVLMKSFKSRAEYLFNYYNRNKARLSGVNFKNYIINEMSSFVKEKTDRKPIIMPLFVRVKSLD